MSDHYSVDHMYEVSLSRLQEALYKYCLSLTKSRWDAEDLAQDAWLRILLKNNTNHGNLQALLLRTAKNAWIDAWRRKQTWSRVLEQRVNSNLDPTSSVDSEDSKDEVLDAITVMMQSLTPLQRVVFLMRSVFGYSAKETADCLHTTEGAVKAAYFRAQKQLREERQVKQETGTEDAEGNGKVDSSRNARDARDSAENGEANSSHEFDSHVREIADALTEGNMEEMIELVGQPLISLDVNAFGQSGLSMMMAA